MASLLDSSSEFAAIVNQLKNSPEDAGLKQSLIKCLPEMRALAEVNPLAMFRLAQIYPPNSSQYRELIIQSANNGCTNAMLAACDLFLNANMSPDVEKAADYFRMIEKSGDTYILKNAQALRESHPELAKALKPADTVCSYNTLRFFPTTKPERREEWAQLDNCLSF